MSLPGAFYGAQPVALHEQIRDRLQSGRLALAFLLELDFASAPARLCNRTVPVIDGQNGNTWLPINVQASWEDIEGGPDNWAPLRIYQLTIPLNIAREFGGEDGPFPDLSNKSEYQGRLAVMSLQLLDVGAGPSGTDAPLGYPAVLHSGRMDRITYSMTRSGVKHELRVEGILARKGVQGARYYTPRDQKRQFPTDLGFDFVPEVSSRRAIWPDY